jgi:molecular chaperone DnaJ
LGCKLKVPVLGGEKEIEIPAGTQPGDTFTLRGAGFPYLPQDGRGQGDQVVHVRVDIPKSLTPEASELFAKLASIENSSVKAEKPKKKGFFQRLKDAVKEQ